MSFVFSGWVHSQIHSVGGGVRCTPSSCLYTRRQQGPQPSHGSSLYREFLVLYIFHIVWQSAIRAFYHGTGVSCQRRLAHLKHITNSPWLHTCSWNYRIHVLRFFELSPQCCIFIWLSFHGWSGVVSSPYNVNGTVCRPYIIGYAPKSTVRLQEPAMMSLVSYSECYIGPIPYSCRRLKKPM